MSRFYEWWYLNVSEPLFERFYRRWWYRWITRTWKYCVSDPWYAIKCRFWSKFNVIRITTLPPTWNDRDNVRLNACFQILVDFVDREHPFDHFVTAGSDHEKDWAEILRLYAWWTVQRPAALGKFDKDNPYHDEDEDQEMLIRLILVRERLWT